MYNLLLVCHISGSVNVPLFARAWSIFVGRHEVLHSRIVDTTEGLQQIPVEKPAFSFVEIEASEGDPQAQVEAVTRQANSYVFELEGGELVRGWLLKSSKGWRFFLASHHLAWDRASVPTIFDETSIIYRALVKGERRESALMPVPYQFIDYTLWQNDWMSKRELVEPHVSYWKAQLAGIPDAVSLFPTAVQQRRRTVEGGGGGRRG